MYYIGRYIRERVAKPLGQPGRRKRGHKFRAVSGRQNCHAIEHFLKQHIYLILAEKVEISQSISFNTSPHALSRFGGTFNFSQRLGYRHSCL